MADIKTRDAVKGTIKTLDKAAIAGERMKSAYAKIKDKAEQGYYAEENSPTEYAADKFAHVSGRIKDEGIHQFNKQGQKSVTTTKENIGRAKDKIAEFKTKRVAKAAEQKKAQAVAEQNGSLIRNGAASRSPVPDVPMRGEMPQPHTGASQLIKTRPQGKRTIKTTARNAEKTVKTTAKGTVKATEKSVKTAKATAEATKATVRATIAGTKALISAIIAGGWVAVVIILLSSCLGVPFSCLARQRQHFLYPCQCGGGSLYAADTEICEAVWHHRICGIDKSGDDAGIWGKGSDSMQAAEGSFNKKYPHEPNGIKDPEYSIECGVQELKVALASAEVESPIDMERIKLALQGYNFGNGYISWAKTNYGGYSYANAVEFSAMQAAKLGWEKYGDTQYPAHVLCYYPYGRAFTGGGNQAIVEIALSQLENEGGQPYWSWYGFDGRVEWCACFGSWCADQCGYLESGIIPKFFLCSDGVNWFKGRGQWQDRNYGAAGRRHYFL